MKSRLDLLFIDSDGKERYEVEIQLGATDESHIIRTIEYWDIERKRYPQYNHTAVIIAEDITSRFLNVISLFNGSIPPKVNPTARLLRGSGKTARAEILAPDLADASKSELTGWSQ